MQECIDKAEGIAIFLTVFKTSVIIVNRPNQSIFLVTVLCSNRVSQMTKTYNDIEAVTRLLEEVNYCTFISNYKRVKVILHVFR